MVFAADAFLDELGERVRLVFHEIMYAAGNLKISQSAFLHAVCEIDRAKTAGPTPSEPSYNPFCRS